MRLLIFVALACVLVSGAAAQTETPTPTETLTPTPTETPTPEPWVFATLEPAVTDEPGQMTRFDYVTTAAEVHIANLLTMILVSLWGMFLFQVMFFARRNK